MLSLTIETKVWEGDWYNLIVREQCRDIFERISCPAERTIIINNVDDEQLVVRLARRLIEKDIVDNVIAVGEHLEEALTHFALSRESLGQGLAYSSAELVGLFMCQTEYLLHFSGDSKMIHQSDWPIEAMALLDRHEVSVVNPIWNGQFSDVKRECPDARGPYQIGYGFSVQCYLVRAQELLDAELNMRHEASERYPVYGGELFEKRVDS